MSGAATTGSDDTEAGTFAEGSLRSGPQHSESLPHAGDRVGRYEIVALLGQGGMGSVWTAYDAELDRRVALKLLHSGADGADPARAVREARTLARLNHPNVVTVYDVGVADQRPWIAMELIDGGTAAQWRSKAPRQWWDVAKLYLEAARGLAAAHAVGVIHRDFKPRNVLVADDGRVMVADFGLARTGDDPAHDTPLHARRLGTPGYIAPETRAGIDDDARIDQFSFCVALFEGVYGVHPFAGSTMLEREAQAMLGRVRSRPSRRAPARLYRALVRGLAADPTQRWPDLDALASELAAIVRARRRPLRVLAIGLATTAIAATVLTAANRDPPCAGGGTDLTDVWNVDERARITAAFTSEARSGRVVAAIDDAANRWSTLYASTCEGVSRWRETPAATHRTLQCLADQRIRLQTLVHGIDGDDPSVLDRASSAVSALSREVAGCERERPETPPDDETSLEIREALARATALRTLGEYDLALAELELHRGGDLARTHSAVSAQLQFELGRLLELAGRAEEARVVLEESFFAAESLDLDEIAIQIATLLVRIYTDQEDFADAHAWQRHAESLVASTPVDNRTWGDLALAGTQLEYAEGDYAASAASAERVLARAEGVLEPDDEVVLLATNDLANAVMRMGDLSRAAELYARVHQGYAELFGPSHRNTLGMLVNLANIHMDDGRSDQAIDELTPGLAIAADELGADHSVTTLLRYTLGLAMHRSGRNEEALELITETRASWERVLGPDNSNTVLSSILIARIEYELGRYDAALARVERILAAFEAMPGKTARDKIVLLVIQAEALTGLGHHDRALAVLEQATTACGMYPAAPDCAEGWRLHAVALRRRADPRALALGRLSRDAYANLGSAKNAAEIDEWLAGR